MKRIVLSCAVCAAFLLLGCASYPAPTEHLANSYANIRTAQALGAASTPQAALHLKMAQEEQAKATALSSDGKNEEADHMTARADSDAELAIAMAREAAAVGRASQASAKAHGVVQESNATPASPGTYSATTTVTSTTVPTSGATK
jgi:hypothetical protein